MLVLEHVSPQASGTDGIVCTLLGVKKSFARLVRMTCALSKITVTGGKISLYIQLYSPECTLAENININNNKQNKDRNILINTVRLNTRYTFMAHPVDA